MRRAVVAAVAMAAAGTTLVAAPPSTAEAAPARTSVTLRVAGCEGCRIQPARWIRGSDDPAWWGRSKKVRKGVVRWSIRRDRMAGLTFFVVRDPRVEDPSALGAVPLVVARYRGKKVGSAVSTAYAKKSRRASPCLAAGGRARFSARVVARYRQVADPAGPGTVTVPRYYFARTQKATKPYSRTFRGTLAAQDVYGCRG